MNPEHLAQLWHEAYERRAIEVGFTTRASAPTPWELVAPPQKDLLVYVAGDVLKELRPEEWREERKGLREALHLWLVSFGAGWFDNVSRERRDKLTEIRDKSNKALGA